MFQSLCEVDLPPGFFKAVTLSFFRSFFLFFPTDFWLPLVSLLKTGHLTLNGAVTLEIRFSCFLKFAVVLFLFLSFNCYRLSVCQGSVCSINLRSSLDLFFAWTYPGHIQWLSNFPYICNCLWIAWGFSVYLSKGEKEKNEMVGGGVCPLNPLEVASTNGKTTVMATASLSAPLWSEVAIRNQSTNPLYLENRVFFCPS